MTSTGTPFVDALASDDVEIRRGAIISAPLSDDVVERVVASLGDADWRVRKEAMHKLAEWHCPRQLAEKLVAQLVAQHGTADESKFGIDIDNVGFRNAAIGTLIALGEHAVPALIESVGPDNGRVKFVIEALGAIASPAATEVLCEVLEYSDVNVVLAGLEALRQIADATAVAQIRRQLRAEASQIRLAALDALACLQVPVEVDEIRSYLEQPLYRTNAIRLLAWSDGRAGVAALIEMYGVNDRLDGELTSALWTILNRQDAEGRAAVVAEIAQAEQVVARLVAIVEGGRLDAKKYAIELLGELGDASHAAAIARAMADQRLIEACCSALTKLGTRAHAALVDVAWDAHGDWRAELFGLIASLDVTGAEAVLLSGLEDDDDFVASAAARALGEVGCLAAEGPLTQMSQQRHRVDVAGAAVFALGTLAERYRRDSIVSCLCDALASPMSPVRAAAALGLAKLGVADAIAAIAKNLEDSVRVARLAAIRALGVFGERAIVHLEAHKRGEHDPEIVAALALAIQEAQGGGTHEEPAT